MDLCRTTITLLCTSSAHVQMHDCHQFLGNTSVLMWWFANRLESVSRLIRWGKIEREGTREPLRNDHVHLMFSMALWNAVGHLQLHHIPPRGKMAGKVIHTTFYKVFLEILLVKQVPSFLLLCMSLLWTFKSENHTPRYLWWFLDCSHVTLRMMQVAFLSSWWWR